MSTYHDAEHWHSLSVRPVVQQLLTDARPSPTASPDRRPGTPDGEQLPLGPEQPEAAPSPLHESEPESSDGGQR